MAAHAKANGGSQTYVAISGNDDAATIAAAGQDIGLKVGTYKSNAGATFTQQTRLEGRGMADATFTTWLTKITCNTDGVDAIYCNALGCVLKDFAVEYTGATPTSGTGVRAPLSSGMRVHDVAAKGFWNNFVLGGFYWKASGLLSVNPKNIGIYVTNSVPDHGDAVLEDFFILAGPQSASATAFKWDAGGGQKLIAGKVSAPDASTFLTGLDFHAPSTTSTTEITVADTVVDTVTGTLVNVAVDGGGGLGDVAFSNCLLRGSSNPTNGYKIRGATDVKIIGGGVELASNGLSCIDIDTSGRVTIEGVELGGIPVANPFILIGSSVTGARVKLGNLKSPAASGGSVWTTGTNQFILRNLGTGSTPTGGGGNIYDLSFRHPTITSNSVYSHLWNISIPTGGSVLAELMLICQNPAGGVSGVASVQKRLIVNISGTLQATTLGTDTATSTDADIQWAISTSFMAIDAKINVGSPMTSLGNQIYSVLKLTGSVQDIKAYA